MTSDSELLQRYARQDDEAAFTELVHRYTDLVYSAALRLVAGDAHLAQDVAQRVFVLLASRAAALSTYASLVGWLYVTTHHCASVAVRTERRRRAREQTAFAMQDEPAGNAVNWARLQPVLDEEVCRLHQADREAVLLRFFQGKSHREVGAALGLSEDLARKRITRALEKLRLAFSRRGLGLSSAALAEVMDAHSVQAAPAGLAATLAQQTLVTAASATVAASTWQTLFLAMKTKIAFAALAIAAGVFLASVWPKSQPASPAGEKTADRLVVPTPPTTVVPSAEANPAGAPRRLETPTPASASASDAPPADPAEQARTELNLAITDFLQLAAANDYATLLRNYVPLKTIRAGGTPTDDDIQQAANDPEKQKTLQSFAAQLATVRDVTPVFGSDNHRAALLLPDGSQSLIFSLQNGSWRIVGFESTQAPPGGAAPPSMKKNPGPGGYVP